MGSQMAKREQFACRVDFGLCSFPFQQMLMSSLPIVLLSVGLLAPLAVLCAPQAHELTASYRRLGPRYQVLKEYTLSGQKNVRYETKPIQYQDAQGNAMDAAKFLAGTSSSGAKSYGCIDMEGRHQEDGAEYERRNGHFKYRCNNGQEEVAACVGSERTNKARIPVGETLEVDGYWHKCEKFANGSVVYTQESSCASGSKKYRVGEEILVGNMRMVCGDQGYSVAGCYFYDNGQMQKMGPGEQRQVGKVTHFCEDKGNTLQYYSKGARQCTKNGQEYAEGDVLSANHLRYKCQDGMMDVTGCYIEENRDLAVGQDVVEKSMVYRCYRLGPKIEYTEYACGFSGTPSCSPAPIPETPDQVPALGRGLISPGFGAFSVVEVNGQQVPSTGSLELKLEKTPSGPMQ